jgi:hypothetical protein
LIHRGAIRIHEMSGVMVSERRVSPWEFIGAVVFAAVLPTLEVVGVLLDYVRHLSLESLK